MQINLPQSYQQVIEEYYASLANPEIGPWPLGIIKSIVALGNNDSVRGEGRFVAMASNVLRTLTETQRAEFVTKYSVSGAILADESAWPDAKPVEVWDNSVDELTVLAEAKLDAVRRVNSIASHARKAFITDIPGQEMLYMKKEQEALSYLAAAEPDITNYPLVAAEIGITAETGEQVAQVYANLGAVFLQTAALLEKARLSAVAMIEQAENTSSVQAVLEAFEHGAFDGLAEEPEAV